MNLWRKLKEIGAVSLKTSAYLLPDTPSHHEHFQWLAQQLRDAGGDATLIRVTEIEGMKGADLVRLFNHARVQEYTELLGVAERVAHRQRKASHRGVFRRAEEAQGALRGDPADRLIRTRSRRRSWPPSSNDRVTTLIRLSAGWTTDPNMCVVVQFT